MDHSAQNSVRRGILACLMVCAGSCAACVWLVGPVSAFGQAPPKGADHSAQPQPAGPPGAKPARNQPRGVPTATPMPIQPGMPNQPKGAVPDQVMPGGMPQPVTTPPAGEGVTVPPAVDKGDVIEFPGFAEGIELRLFVDLVIEQAKVQIMVTDGATAAMTRKVFLPQKLNIPKAELMQFLTLLLEQGGATIAQDVANLYVIRAANDIPVKFGDGEFFSTRVIPTRGLRPTSLQQAVSQALGGGAAGVTGFQPGAPGAPQGNTGAGGGSVAYLDDLGVIIITNTPRRIQAVTAMLEALLAEQSKQEIIRFELKYIAAQTARQRLLELLGRGGGGRTGLIPGVGVSPQELAAQFNPNPGAGGNAGGQNLVNLVDRLTPDPLSNALIFRGRTDEKLFLQKLLDTIDRPNQLVAKQYSLPGSAEQLASLGARQGLGAVVRLPGTHGSGVGGGLDAVFQQGFPQGQFNVSFPGQFGQSQQGGEVSGPTFIVDSEGRGFIYYGTPEQHDQVRMMVASLRDFTSPEELELQFYKLKHSKAQEVAEVINNLLSNQRPAAGGGLLPTAPNQPRQPRLPRGVQPTPQPTTTPTPSIAGSTGGPGGSGPRTGGLSALVGDENTFVLGDDKLNLVLVRAARRLQPEFKTLIERLDARRPQVYLDVKILAVTDNQDFRLAVETQIAAGQSATQTNFGLSAPRSGAGTPLQPIQAARIVGTGLPGLTTALIRSDFVPFVLTAIQNNTDSKFIASPQLLVNDNEPASVKTIDSRPTVTTTSLGTSGTGNVVQGAGENATAETSLDVTPQIGDGGAVRLKFKIKQEAFTGDPPIPQAEPPKLTNSLESDAVTVPSDATIVVGGLSIDSTRNTVIKVPLIGDIPIVGQLFRDTRQTTTRTTLYVFITPRIMRDENFADLRLLSQGPAQLLPVDARAEVPSPEPVRYDTPGPGPGAIPRGPDGSGEPLGAAPASSRPGFVPANGPANGAAGSSPASPTTPGGQP